MIWLQPCSQRKRSLRVAFIEAGQASHSLPAKKITLVSTHGAGDCFMGVLCQALSLDSNLAHAVAKANDAAALHVSQKMA